MERIFEFITENCQYIVTPLLGAFIGYFTNWLAIKMLFRPRKAHYLVKRKTVVHSPDGIAPDEVRYEYKLKLPFTPGIIPKEKSRIAKSIGKTVGERLLSPEDLKSALLSSDVTEKLSRAVDGFLQKERENPNLIGDYIGDGKLVSEQTETKISGFIKKVVTDFVTGFDVKKTINELGNPLFALASGAIERTIKENAPQLVEKAVDGEIGKLKQKPVFEIVPNEDNSAKIKEFVLQVYQKLVSEKIVDVINAVDVAALVENKINSFDAAELEKLLMKIMNRELKAVVNLGALLGLLVGIVNVLLL